MRSETNFFIVAAGKCFSYDLSEVSLALRAALGHIGGMKTYVQPDQRVLIKPNLLASRSPETAVTTHPAVVEAVVKLVQECQGHPYIADSPAGFGDAEKIKHIWRITGMMDVANRTGAQLLTVEKSSLKEICLQTNREKIKTIILDREKAGFDVIINVPKFKTHDLTGFTGAIKNMFGFVPGLSKVYFHKAAPGKEIFSDLLVELFKHCTPELTIMDGILGMEGEGPGSQGIPRPIGILLASPNALALDMVVEHLMGFPQGKTAIVKAAIREGLGPAKMENIEVRGAPLAEIKPEHFLLPPTSFLEKIPDFFIPVVTAVAKRIRLSKPFVEQHLCSGCLVCISSCPVGALEKKGKRIRVVYQKCIECFCCVELCPHKAITAKRGFLLTALRWVRKWLKKEPK